MTSLKPRPLSKWGAGNAHPPLGAFDIQTSFLGAVLGAGQVPSSAQPLGIVDAFAGSDWGRTPRRSRGKGVWICSRWQGLGETARRGRGELGRW